MHLKILAIPISFAFFFGIISNSAMPAYAEISDCTATLDGSQEVPSVNTTAMGSANVTFDSDTNELSWEIEFSELSGPATGAHFHGPAAAGVNAGVQVNIGDISGLTSPMNGSATLTSSQASSLLDGDMYINIHTAANPNGEIRGQVTCEEETPTPTDGEWETATLTIGDDEFDIQYMITNGTLDELTGNNETSTITAMITANETGTLMIKLPRDIIDAVGSNGTDSDYVVMVDGVAESVDDDFGQDVRTLTIPFPAESEQIDITGTFIVPEFSAITAIMLSVAIVGVVIAATRYGKFSLSSKS